MTKEVTNMVTKTTVVGVRLTNNDIVNLNAIVQKTGMNQSEVVRQLLKKAVGDEKCLQIITQNSFNEKAYARELRRTSYNVQNERKADEPYRQPTGCCPEPQEQDSIAKRLCQIVQIVRKGDTPNDEDLEFAIDHWKEIMGKDQIAMPKKLEELCNDYIKKEVDSLYA